MFIYRILFPVIACLSVCPLLAQQTKLQEKLDRKQYADVLARATEAERLFHRVLAIDSLNFYANLQLAPALLPIGRFLLP